VLFGCSHVLPRLDELVKLSLACMDVPALTEPNMPSANNAIWSLGELMLKVCAQQKITCLLRSTAGLSIVVQTIQQRCCKRARPAVYVSSDSIATLKVYNFVLQGVHASDAGPRNQLYVCA
jgi:hypothetical protein